MRGPKYKRLPLLSLLLPLSLVTGAVPANYELVWSDEFEYSGAPDVTKWTHETGAGGWGNGEVQTYTDALENSRVENGHLIIEAHQVLGTRVPAYTSARLVTRDKGEWKYGRMEIRAQLPAATGTWSAIWMLAAEDLYGDGYWPDNGEIDIMEHVGYKEDPAFKNLMGDAQLPNIHSTLHTEQRNHMSGSGIGNETHVPDATSTFHVYAVNWTEEGMEFEIDGEVYFTVNRDDHIPLRNPPEDPWAYWPFKEKFFLILNIAVGGDWGGVFNSDYFPDSPYGSDGIDHDAAWPQRMTVDYVRIYQEASAPTTWKGLPLDSEGDAETDSWGRINVRAAPWLWSYRLNNFIYPEAAFAEEFHTGPQWVYIPRT